MSCDFTQYQQLRQDTQSKADAAKDKCDNLLQKEQALLDAQAARDQAHTEKVDAYSAWEAAEQAENSAARDLGINPIPPGA